MFIISALEFLQQIMNSALIMHSAYICRYIYMCVYFTSISPKFNQFFTCATANATEFLHVSVDAAACAYICI